MKSKFEPDLDSGLRLPPAVRLIDPEAYDASEQRFAASVEEKVEEKPVPRRFVVDAVQEPQSNPAAGDGSSHAEGGGNELDGEPDKMPGAPNEGSSLVAKTVAEPSLQTELLRPQERDSWRHEVAARVDNYRARRRPRAPRYPSLQLKFEPSEPSTVQVAGQPPTTAVPSRLAVAMQDAPAVSQRELSIQPETYDAPRLNVQEAGARILEFPRSAAPPPVFPPPVFDELAEPVVDRPRILEVPELELPPPALGGILMDPVAEPEKERRPGFELPLQAAPFSRRLLAGAIDSLFVLTAFAIFAYIFFRIASIVPAPQQAAGISVSLIALFWIAYQYLLLVFTGTTPGLKLARLQLSRFDGSAVPVRIRRWRVLASVLSGLSLALGYAWCFLDEDRLCWHDRITRTYMAPNQTRVGTGVAEPRL
ncbi:MAG: RDD family protein [Terriglobales bacterium]